MEEIKTDIKENLGAEESGDVIEESPDNIQPIPSSIVSEYFHYSDADGRSIQLGSSTFNVVSLGNLAAQFLGYDFKLKKNGEIPTYTP